MYGFLKGLKGTFLRFWWQELGFSDRILEYYNAILGFYNALLGFQTDWFLWQKERIINRFLVGRMKLN